MTFPALPVRVAVTAARALTVVACSNGQPATQEPAAGAGGDAATVVVADMAYDPATLTVDAGTTVTWVFDDGAISHDVAGDGFQSDIVESGTFSHRFDDPGTYDYLCSLHPNMTGTVEVVE